jgi:hypothetical protein
MRDFADCLAANKRNKGGFMNYLGVKHGLPFRSGLVLLLVLWAGGCGHEAKEAKEAEDATDSSKKYVKFKCEDVTVNVDPKMGANPTAVYVCENNKVTWKDNGHAFKVEFKADSPFEGDEKVFHNVHATSPSAKKLKPLTVFEYKITVDKDKVFDPQVIGGGGN